MQSPAAITPSAASQPSTGLRQTTSAGTRASTLQKTQTGETIRDSGNPVLEIFSPVTENGCFECDKVLKSGEVLRRTKKTKTWKPIYLVLRPNLLSIYKDKDETKLRDQIVLSEITAVARQKDPKKKAQHVFGLFSSSRNTHLSAASEQDAQEWVELIRREARIDEEEEEMILKSPSGGQHQYHGFERHVNQENFGSSSSELELRPRGQVRASNERVHTAGPPPQGLVEYSGNEDGSYTDVSDTVTWMNSALSLSNPGNHVASRSSTIYNSSRPKAQRNPSQMSGLGLTTQDEERVVFHGWLYILKSKGGVRQWKKLWVVLRPKTLALYKDQEEYSANLIIPFPSILDAVDIDPISRSKRYCMQIISEECNYRFCAPDEDALAKWLGALKSLLVKRREVGMQRAAAAQAPQPVR